MPILQYFVRIVLSCHIQEGMQGFSLLIMVQIWNNPVVAGSMNWTNTVEGMACLLIFPESLWMGDKLDHTLVNPNKLKENCCQCPGQSFRRQAPLYYHR